MSDHVHPDYEEYFSRMLSLLEKLTMNMDRLTDAQVRVAEAQFKQSEAIERLAMKSARTEDKLSRLIDLMEGHIRQRVQ